MRNWGNRNLEPPQELAPAPVIATESVAACAVCGGVETHAYARGYDYELRTCRNEWTFVQCTGCGHVWLNPRPAVETLAVIYPPHYYAYDYETRVNAIARRGKAVLDRPEAARDRQEARSRAANVHRRRLRLRPVSARDGGAGAREARHSRPRTRSARDRQARRGGVRCRVCARRRRIDSAQHDRPRDDVSCDRARRCARIASCAALPTGSPRVGCWRWRPRISTRSTGGSSPIATGAGTTFRATGICSPQETLGRLLRSAGLEPMATMYQTGHSFWMFSVHHWLRYSGRPQRGLSRLFDPFSSVVPLAAVDGVRRRRAPRPECARRRC